MAAIKTTVRVPEFDRENIQMYLDELTMWAMVTEVEKKKQGPLVWMSLPKNDPSNIKQFINDSIGVTDLSKDDGIDKLIEAMKKAFQEEGEIEAFSKWKEFDKVKRKEEEVRTFVNRFNTAYNAISRKQITIPPGTRSFILVQKASISEKLERLVIHKVDFTKDDCYEEVSKSLIRIMGDSKKVTSDLGEEVCVAEQVEERVNEVMAGMSGRWGKKLGGKRTGGKVGAGGATGDKIKKPLNKKDEDGNRLRCKNCKSIRHMKEICKDKQKEDNKAGSNGEILRCISCDSKKHLLPQCPHSWENMVNFVESDSSGSEDSFFSMAGTDAIDDAVFYSSKEKNMLGGFGWNVAIIDTGCNKSVAGREWSKEYLAALGDEDRSRVVIKDVPEGQKFRFGGGKVFAAEKEIRAPVMIGTNRYYLRWHVVEAPIPLLWGKESMKKAGVLLDLPKDRARVKGEWMELTTAEGSHYGIDLLPRTESTRKFETLVAEGDGEDDYRDSDQEDKEVAVKENKKRTGRNRNLLPEGEHKLFLKMRHIHRQLGHPCKRVWTQMLKEAGLWSKDTSKSVDRIHEECGICKQYSNTPSNPVVSMMSASEPGKVVAVDLKEKKLQDYKYIFYGIDVFSKLMFGSLIKTKQTSEIVREFLVKYVQGGGMMPDRLWSDCGGEFNSYMMKDLCENLNIEIATGPGYTPTSNAVVERHHAVVDRILEKMMEEKPEMDPQEALGWALHAHNSYPGTYGWSPFQLTYGRNPRLPGVGGDRLPALTGTVTEVVAGHINNLLSAQRNYREAVNLKKIKTALAHKIRSTEKEFKNGEKVYFKRENLKQGNRNKWSGPATVIGKHNNMYYISHQSSLLRISPQRLIGVPDAENITNSEEIDQEGSEKQVTFPNPEDHMDFEREQLEIEVGEEDPDNEGNRDDNQDEFESAEENDLDEGENGEENDNPDEGENDAGDGNYNEGDNTEQNEENEGGIVREDEEGGEQVDPEEEEAGEETSTKMTEVQKMMRNKVMVEGEPGRAPKAGDTIQYLNKDVGWEKVTVSSRYFRRSGYVNVENSDGDKFGVDLATGSWKYDVLAAEGIQDTFVTFIPEARWGEIECLEAKKKEISMWEKFGVVENIEDTDQEPRILTKWIVTEKTDDGGENRVKARLVVLGNMEEGLPSIQTQSPTCGKDTVRLLLTVAASYGWEAVMIDLTNAYFQAELSKREGGLYLVPPSDIKDDGMIWRVKGNLYGLRDGAANLRKKAIKHLKQIGGVQSETDPCLIIFKKQGETQGAATIWVDDYFVVGTQEIRQFVQKKIQEEFTVGRIVKDSFKYLGIKMEVRKDGGFQQHQKEYIDILEEVEIPIKNTKDNLDEHGLTILRHGTGKLNWAAQGTRPELCFRVAELSTHFKNGSVSHLKMINKCIKDVQSNSVVVQYPKLKNELVIVGFCDAALHNMDDKVSSGGGYIIFIADKELRSAPVSWTSTKIKRVVRSSLAAEALIAVECADAMYYIKAMIREILTMEVKMVLITDSNNLVESLKSPHPVQEKRLRVDMAALKKDVTEGVIEIKHCIGSKQVADVLTKNGVSAELVRKVLNQGSLKGVVEGL